MSNFSKILQKVGSGDFNSRLLAIQGIQRGAVSFNGGGKKYRILIKFHKVL